MSQNKSFNNLHLIDLEKGDINKGKIAYILIGSDELVYEYQDIEKVDRIVLAAYDLNDEKTKEFGHQKKGYKIRGRKYYILKIIAFYTCSSCSL